jgi:hypothetical protein
LRATNTGLWALNGTLRAFVEKSHPGLVNDNAAETAQAEAA